MLHLGKHKIERNDPCWCGSGRKYKTCHMRFDERLRKMQIAGAIVPEGLLRLVERRAAERSQEAESDPLTFYEKGCRILSALLGALLMARRRLFR